MQKRFLPAVLLLSVLLAMFVACGLQLERTTAAFSFAAAENARRVYLTFDDGPSTVVTGRVLDILKKEGIKATFFIVSDMAKTRQETLLRIAEEGHSLGVHSASHDYQRIYSSDEALLSDIDECAAYIFHTTGVTPRLYRFPGGGHERQRELIRERGYEIVGWNAVCGDEEIPHASAERLVEEAVRTSRGKDPVILLLHDSARHRETAKALPSIIAHFREEGCVFCAF